MHVILLFVKTVLSTIVYQLPLPLPSDPELFVKGEASILKIYLQDKFPMGNLVNLVYNETTT
jgi:hypothetical protein